MKQTGSRTARERILEAAAPLFYRDGFQAVGVDTIVAESGVAKMTLYRHFPSKDELIAAYLERANAEFWDWLNGAMDRVDDPEAKLVAVFESVSKLSTDPHCLGCTFQASAAEFPDLDHPGHRVALAHKTRVIERFAELADAARLRSPDALARQLFLLMEGAWMSIRMFGGKSPAADVVDAAQALIAAHGSSRRGRGRPRTR
jgi:AcrR family transcriptional regulator